MPEEEGPLVSRMEDGGAGERWPVREARSSVRSALDDGVSVRAGEPDLAMLLRRFARVCCRERAALAL